MPRLSDSMEEGTIVRWLKQDGEAVSPGEPIAEVETDKATVTFDAEAGGVLRILVSEGATVPIGALLARIGDGALGPAGPVDAAPPTDGAARVKASPLARRIAREAKVDLRAIAGSGPGGRIVKADLDALLPPGRDDPEPREPEPVRLEPVVPEPPSPAPEPAPPEPERVVGGKGRVTVERPSRTQVQIAQRMSESKATIPDFALESEVGMDHAVALRGQLRDEPRVADALPSYNDMVVKACALALREHPRANAAYRDGAFELYERVNVGIAVATEDSLIVPTIFDADRKSLLQIASEARTLATRVRDRLITPAELSGATFTVSNLGMYGVKSFVAIVNPPQAAILAVGELREAPVVRGGDLVAGWRMNLVLTCDHRILYGAPAARFLARVRELLERPVSLLL
jgi:pyruvate dehydrogenase E2 component (dihydrolipoamide acetyltransferase)